MTSKVRCSECGRELQEDTTAHRKPCPTCGSTRRTFEERLTETVTASVSLSWEHRREFYEKNPKLWWTALGLTLGASLLGIGLFGLLGGIAGIALGWIGYFLGPKAVIKVREITRG